MSGFYALACRKEVGPRGSWTEEQEREGDPITQNRRSDYARLRITQGLGPSTQRTRTENNTDRHNQRICTYERKKITEQDITTHGGHGIATSEQGGEQMPIPVCYDTQKREAGRRCCRTHSGRSTKQREPPRNPAQDTVEQKTEREREAPKSVRQHFVLSTRDIFLLFFLFLL